MYLVTRCGHKMTVSQAAERRLLAHPEIWSILPDAISRVVLPTNEQTLATVVHMGRITGRSGCVEAPRVGLHMTTTFAQRRNRSALSRVAVDAIGREISHIAVKAIPTERLGVYALQTAYVGDLTPPEPWKPNLTRDEWIASFNFWATHALVYDRNTMGPVTETTWQDVCQSTQVNQ